MQKYIRVMLVDDEYLAVEDLKTLIDWNLLGFQISATARSGRQALHIFETNPVELVITDISMPNMDGIDLIGQLKKKYPNLLFLLLTAYAEINYMKRAFQLGVEDYLMKNEITSDILCAKLAAIREKYQTSCRLSYSFLQKTMSSYFSDVNALFPEGLTLIPNNNLLYCILIPDLIFPWIDEVLLLKNVSATRIINAAFHYLENYRTNGPENLCTFTAYNNKIVTILHIDKIPSTASRLQILQQFAHNLIFDLQKQLHSSFSCFYSQIPMTLEKLHADYFSRQKSIRARYFLGSRLTEPLDSPKLFVINEKLELTDEKLKAIMNDPNENLSAYIKQEFQQIINSHNYIGLSHLINTCFSFLLKTSDITKSGLEQMELTDASGIMDFILDTIARIQEESHPDYSRETQKAIRYISKHYNQEQLSIQEISNEIGLSGTHFSRIFKMDTGETVWDYLTAFRVQKACDMLRNTDARIYEIAEKTGYSSPQYFSQVFYKQMGVKPLEYRKGN